MDFFGFVLLKKEEKERILSENAQLREENVRFVHLAKKALKESKSEVRKSENAKIIAENKKAEMVALLAKEVAEKQLNVWRGEPNQSAFLGVSCVREKEASMETLKSEQWGV